MYFIVSCVVSCISGSYYCPSQQVYSNCPSNKTRGNGQKHLCCFSDLALEQSAERLWGVLLCRYSRTFCMQTCAICSGMTLLMNGEIEPVDLPGGPFQLNYF